VNSPKESHDPSALLLELCRIKLGDVGVVVAPQKDQLPDHCGIEATIHPVLLAIEPVGLPINHPQKAVLLITLSVQSPYNATVVLAHVVEGGLQWIVVLNHARLRIVHTDREVTGSVASVDQPSWSMEIETWNEYHVRSSDIPVCECSSSKGGSLSSAARTSGCCIALKCSVKPNAVVTIAAGVRRNAIIAIR
jgi:hypothetical protein